jgi:hypothetical protein
MSKLYLVRAAAGGDAWLPLAEAVAALRDGTATGLVIDGVLLPAVAALRRLQPRLLGTINGAQAPQFGHNRQTR